MGGRPGTQSDPRLSRGIVNLRENSEMQNGSEDPIQIGSSEVVPEELKPHRKKGRRSRRRPSKEDEQRTNVFWNFRYELLALILFGLGVFLLLEKFKIRTWLAGLVIEGLGHLREAAVWLLGATSAVEKSDIVGIVLLLCAVGLVGIDIRSRILRRHEEIEAEPLCTKCGRQMRRSRTSRFLQGLSTIFRVRIKRFACSKCHHRISVWRPPHESDW